MNPSESDVKIIVSADISGVKPGIDEVNTQLRSMAEKAKVTSSATYDLFSRVDAGASKSAEQTQKTTRSFTGLKDEVGKTSGFFDRYSFALRNASYQLTDFAVQVQNGQRVSVALGQQLPQLLAGFGTMGAVAGLTASILPSVVSALSSTEGGAKTLHDAVDGLKGAIDDVGSTARKFSMDELYTEYNKANEATRLAMIEQVKFQQTLIETQRLISQQSLSKSLSGVGDYSFIDRMKGAYGESPAEKLANEYGVSVGAAKDLLPAIKGLRDGSEDASNFMARFGVELAKSSKAPAQKLVADVKSLADAGRDAAAAQSRLSEAASKMGKAGGSGKIEIDEKGKRGRSAGAGVSDYDQTMRTLAERIAVQELELGSTEKLTAAEREHAKWLADVDSGRRKLTASERQAAEAKWQTLLGLEKENAEHQKYLAAVEKQEATNQKAYTSTLDKIAAAEREAELMGLSEAQISAVEQARLADAIAIAAENGATPEMLAALREELTLRAKLTDALSARDLKKFELEDAKKAVSDAGKEMNEFAKSAAKNMQSALADFLFDPFEKGADKMAQQFGKTIQRMIAEAASAQLTQALFGNIGKTGVIASDSLVGKGMSWLGGLFGGGSSSSGSGSSASVPSSLMPGEHDWMKDAFSFVKDWSFLPSFDVGTDYVPRDMVAQIHKGERIVPAAQNKPGMQAGQAINQTLIFHGAADPAQVKRAAAAGYRSAAGAMATAGRYA